MKKIIAIMLLVTCAFLMTSCGKAPITEESDECGFFHRIGSYGETIFLYDPFTKIVYVKIDEYSESGLSPYYIVKNGEAVIARYGVNWTEANFSNRVIEERDIY